MGISRRNFIKSSATAGAGLMLTGRAPVYAAPKTKKSVLGDIKGQDKALVFIMLDGGNDSFNMLVPTSEPHYKEYKNSRSNLALNKSSLLPLKGFKDNNNRSFGLHESMPDIQQLFSERRLAFVANTGPMIEPVSKPDFYNGQVKLPLGLMSHSDQFKHWQTARPGERINRGWFGYFADAIQKSKAMEDIPMNISLAGSNIMQNGHSAAPYSITKSGS
ncbi:twin-arginine translocation signal domain-containing protein, partial [Vibrio parahaemolyticus]|nr:twin-arginine translocation signal domain-containing protein [Vibrio parahaemolyticus]